MMMIDDYAYQERIAIMMFDGGMRESRAKERARADMKNIERAKYKFNATKSSQQAERRLKKLRKVVQSALTDIAQTRLFDEK